MNFKFILLLMITMALAVFTVVFAKHKDPQWPCRVDADKLCQDLQNNKDVLACLKKSRLKLSTECKKEIDKVADTKIVEPDCEADSNKDDKKKGEKKVEEKEPDETCLPELVFEEIKGEE